MAFPSSIDSFLNPSGTTLLSAGHSLDHRQLGSAVVAIETVIGTTAGTSVLKNFVAGNFPARINASNVLQQAIQGTINASTLGSPTITGGVFNTGTLGTPTITGGNWNTGTLGTAFIGTSTFYGGTIDAPKVLTPTVATVSDSAGGTINYSMANGQIVEITLGTTAGNRTMAVPTFMVDGQFVQFRIKQNAGNTGTLVWASGYRFSSDIGTPGLGTESTWNHFSWRYHTGDTKLDFMGQSKNII